MQNCVRKEKQNKRREKNSTKGYEVTVKRTKMLVPDNQLNPPKHVVSMFLATGGAGGHLLGSDEKEIIYLVFGIIDLQNKEVSDHPRQPEKKEKKRSKRSAFH